MKSVSLVREDNAQTLNVCVVVLLNATELFIKEFFDQNPISQLSLIVTKNSKADKITDLSGNPNRHINAMKTHPAMEGNMKVVLNEEHFKECLMLHCQPPPTFGKVEAALVEMGFPQQHTSSALSLCIPLFEEINWSDYPLDTTCFGCLCAPSHSSLFFKCPRCSQYEPAEICHLLPPTLILKN
eukprot:gene437-521_t